VWEGGEVWGGWADGGAGGRREEEGEAGLGVGRGGGGGGGGLMLKGVKVTKGQEG
jgi:hypothetical protein